ncbi:unnamed protein product [Spodoptera exigua]|nr:unnamed protein product [Spodoptera exigua]
MDVSGVLDVMGGSSELELLARHAVDSDDPCATHDHAMVFHSCVCAEILFNGWKTTNELQLFGSAVAIFVASVLYEGFKYWRETLPSPAAKPISDSRQNIAKDGAARAAVDAELPADAGVHDVQRVALSGCRARPHARLLPLRLAAELPQRPQRALPVTGRDLG